MTTIKLPVRRGRYPDPLFMDADGDAISPDTIAAALNEQQAMRRAAQQALELLGNLSHDPTSGFTAEERRGIEDNLARALSSTPALPDAPPTPQSAVGECLTESELSVVGEVLAARTNGELLEIYILDEEGVCAWCPDESSYYRIASIHHKWKADLETILRFAMHTFQSKAGPDTAPLNTQAIERDAVLEEAAKVAERLLSLPADECNVPYDKVTGAEITTRIQTARYTATAIRALKGKPEERKI